MSDVKKREESRLHLGLETRYENGEIIYKGGKNTWEKVVFMTKINSSVLDMISLSYFTTKWRHLNKWVWSRDTELAHRGSKNIEAKVKGQRTAPRGSAVITGRKKETAKKAEEEQPGVFSDLTLWTGLYFSLF